MIGSEPDYRVLRCGLRRLTFMVLMAAGLLVLVPQFIAAQPKKEEAWIRADSANFTFFSSLNEKNTRRVADDLEAMRALLVRLVPSGAPSSPRPTLVYIFKTSRAFEPYWPIVDGRPYPLASMFNPRIDANYITINGGGDELSSALTAYAFDFASTQFRNAPNWLGRGLGEYYGTFRADGKRLAIGLPDDRNLMTLREQALMPMEEMFAVTDEQAWSRNRHWRPRYDAQCWATVHYLIHSEARQGQIDKYLYLLEDGTLEPEAFARAFHTTRKALGIEVYGYINNRLFSYGKLDRAAIQIDESFATEAIPWDEMLWRLGDLLVEGEDRRGEAEAHFAAALARNPDSAGARTSRGVLAYESEELSGAIRWFDEALELDATDYRANLYLAAALRKEGAGESGWWDELSEESRRRIERGRAAAERCIVVEPSHGTCFEELGHTFSYDREPRAGIEALSTALRFQPSRVHIAMNLLELLSQDGDFKGVEQILTAYRPRLDEEMLRYAEKSYAQAYQRAAAKEVEAGNHKAAAVLLETALSRTRDPGDQGRIQRQLEQLRKYLAQ